MANPDESFVSQRLGSLSRPDVFVPNKTKARLRLEGRAVHRRRRAWKAALTAVVFLFFVGFPAVRAVAQTGGLSLESFARAFHQTLFEVHRFVYHVYGTLWDWFAS
jgi:hypothetical protein